jgi:hypothetical protein
MVVQQRCHGWIDDEYDVTAAAAVATVRTTERLELLAMRRRTSVSAVARGDMQDDTVDEGGAGHYGRSFASGVRPATEGC